MLGLNLSFQTDSCCLQQLLPQENLLFLIQVKVSLEKYPVVAERLTLVSTCRRRIQTWLTKTACEHCIATACSVNMYARSFVLYSHMQTEVQECSQAPLPLRLC